MGGSRGLSSLRYIQIPLGCRYANFIAVIWPMLVRDTNWQHLVDDLQAAGNGCATIEDFELYLGPPEAYRTDMNTWQLEAMCDSMSGILVLRKHLPLFEWAGNCQEITYVDIVQKMPELSFTIIMVPHVRFRLWRTPEYCKRMYMAKYLDSLISINYDKALNVCGHLWR
jgi:hypothetical protein